MAQDRRRILDVQTRQEGSRWIGERPTGEQLARWFLENVRLDEGMDPQQWVGGITLISSSETTTALHDGQMVDMQRLVHVPYARVDARIGYFWALCARRGWLGEIAPVKVPRLRTEGYFNEHLPPGFARMPVKLLDGKTMSFLTCTQKVTVYERDVRAGGRGRIVMDPPPATKQVAMLDRFGRPDQNVMMKAETGAVGRALGMAGIFVLPGSGVATAEDMAEFLAAERPPAELETPQLPPPAANGGSQAEDTPTRIRELLLQLEQKPEHYAEFEAWAAQKDINPAEPRPSQLRSLLRKLESYFV